MGLHGTLRWAGCATCVAESETVIRFDGIFGIFVVLGVLFTYLDDILQFSQADSLLFEEFLLLL